MTRPLLLGLRPLGLGDFCTAVPAWKALRRAFPEHDLVLAAPRHQLGLLRLCPAIDALVDAEPLAALPGGLRGADIAVNLHGRGPQSTRILAEIRPKQLVAFAHPDVAASSRGPEWHDDEHEVRRWCRLVETVGASSDPDDLDLARPPIRTPHPEATIVHAGAASEARRWPIERWIRLIDRLIARGHRIVLTGTVAEAPLTSTIASAVRERPGAAPPITDLAGRTDIEELAALTAVARLVVSGDTGIAHLATAYRRPSVTLFGPTPPSLWGPPRRHRHRPIWHGQRGDPHGSHPDPGLLEITVDEVLAEIDDLDRLPITGTTRPTASPEPPADPAPPTVTTVPARPTATRSPR